MMQEQHLNRLDFWAILTAVASFFKIIPWPEIAAFLAALYTFLRLVGLLVRWCKNKKE